MFCDQCGRPVPPAAAACPHCGAALSDPKPAIPRQAPPPPAPTLPLPPGLVPGRFARGPRLRAWLSALLLNNFRGSMAGIFAAWFNVPFVVLMAAFGAVIGGLTGVVSGTFAGPGVTDRINTLLTWVFPLPVRAQDLLPVAGAQIGGIVGGILGALNGGFELAWRAAVWPWQALYAGDPTWPAAVAVGQVVTALFVGGLYVAWATVTESRALRFRRARAMSRREAAWLMPIVDEVGQRMGLKGALPRILIDDRQTPGASAGIRHIVLNYGLFEQLDYDREALAAVLAHELDHWRRGDVVAQAWSKGVALPLYLLFEFSHHLLNSTRSRPLHFMVRFLFWSVRATVRYFVIPIQQRWQHNIEYRADAAAAAAGYTEGMRKVLTYFRHTFHGQRSGWDQAICAVHPSNELRLERLEVAGRTYPLRYHTPVPVPTGSTVQKGW